MLHPLPSSARQLVRVWIVEYEDWEPSHWLDIPPDAVAVAPVGDDCWQLADALSFVEGFNSQALATPHGRWAIVHHVEIRLDGDLSPGERLNTAPL